MALISQLLAPEDFVKLSKQEVDNLWSIAYAEILKSPDLISSLRAQMEERVLPVVRRE
jgi:hypothetical protein